MALRTSLVSWWELNETSGTRNDSHGVNHLTDVNTVLSATGKQGNGADFEKDTSESLQIAEASQVGLDITGDMSISAWVKWESQTNAQVNLICGKQDSATDFAYYFMNWDTEAPLGTRALALWLKRTDGTSKIFYKTYAFSTATWYHVTATYKASTGTVTFYINGSSIGTHVDATYTAIKDITTGGFAIGARYNDEGYTTDGIIDELGIWSKELTSAEVTQLYNSGNGLTYAQTAETVAGDNFQMGAEM